MNNKKALSQLCTGEEGTVTSLDISGRMRRRLQDLGVINGTKITCVFHAPFGDPTAYEVRGALIALRKEDAEKIIIKPPERR